MARRTDKTIERPRAYLDGNLVTVIERGRRTSTIRDRFGYVHEDVPNRDLDFDVEEDHAKLVFEPPH